MRFQWFRYPVEGDHDLSDLNEFIASHSIISLRRDWVQGMNGPLLVFVVEYRGGRPPSEPPVGRKPETDIFQGLSDHQLALFDRLRDLRKEIAKESAVPVYTICGNKSLRLIVTQVPESIESLAQIAGVGKSRAAKYGERILGVLQDTGMDRATSSNDGDAAPSGSVECAGSEPKS